jgi:hypothetical protein
MEKSRNHLKNNTAAPPEISLNARFPTPPAARAGFLRRHWHGTSKLHDLEVGGEVTKVAPCPRPATPKIEQPRLTPKRLIVVIRYMTNSTAR